MRALAAAGRPLRTLRWSSNRKDRGRGRSRPHPPKRMRLPWTLLALLALVWSPWQAPGAAAQESEDRAALLELKAALLAAVSAQHPDALPRAESALQQWGNASDPCGGGGGGGAPWPHLGCTQGRVTSLALASCGLAGPLPDPLTRLAALTSLSLRSNTLIGPVPGAALARLSLLQNLDLGFNRLQGPLPDALSGLLRLTSLALPGNALAGALPPSLSALTALQVLDLSGNRLQGVPPQEARGGNRNALQGPLPDLSRATGLRVLSLAVNELAGAIPAWLGGLRQLSFLGLRDNRLSGSVPASLGGATALRRVYLGGNRLSGPLPASLGGLSRLELLLAAQNSLQGPLPPSLGALGALRQLDLGFNRLLGGALPASLTRLSGLQLLRLSGCALSGPLPQNMSRLGALEQLLVSGNQLSGGIPTDLCALPHLRTLDFSANQLTGPIPGCLLSSPSLQGLRLSHNLLSGPLPSPPSHAGPSTLTDFRYDHNCLSGDVAEQYQDPSCPPPGAPVPGEGGSSAGAGSVPVAAIAGGAALLLVLLLVLALALLALRRRAAWPQGLLRLRHARRYRERPPVPRLSWAQVRQSTQDFETVLGQGDFGAAYRGSGEHCGWPGREVVVRRASDPAVLALDEAEFEKKVVGLCRARHSYVVNLLGYCAEARERVLVYEHLPGGSLQQRLHGGDQDAPPLPWDSRVKVAATLAAALEHLHNGVGPPMVHGALSSAHVLLTSEMAAKVADIGLARPASAAKKPRRRKVKFGEKKAEEPKEGGGQGQGAVAVAVAPEGVSTGEQVDVYGFGVVLLELITGRRERKDEVHITAVAAPFLEDPAMTALMADPRLASRFPPRELLVLASLAASCTAPDPALRPSMREVLLLMEEHLPLDPSWLRPPPDPSLPDDLDVEELYGAATTTHTLTSIHSAGAPRAWASSSSWASWGGGRTFPVFSTFSTFSTFQSWPVSGGYGPSEGAETGPGQWLGRVAGGAVRRLREAWPAGAVWGGGRSGKESPEHGPGGEAGPGGPRVEPLGSFDEALVLLKGARSAALL